MAKPVVSIVMGSDSDLETMNEAASVLKKFGVQHEMRVLSAHRSPKDVVNFSLGASSRGIKVIIAGAGGAAHLAGVIAAHTNLPVIGIPIETKSLRGMDSLLSTVQMPGGIPVATMSIGKSGAKNAGILAVQILALSGSKLKAKLKQQKEALACEVRKKDKAVRCKNG